MSPPIDPGYLRAVDGIRDELHRHIDDCMSDRQQTRADAERKHEDNQTVAKEQSGRLLAIELRLAELKGAGKLAKWLSGSSLIGVGAGSMWLLKLVGVLR